MVAHLQDNRPIHVLYPLSFVALLWRTLAAFPAWLWRLDATHSPCQTEDCRKSVGPSPRRSSSNVRGGRSFLFLAALVGVTCAPEAHAQHICDQAGIECHAPEAGPWSFWVTAPSAPNFPIVYDRFSTEGEAIAAGNAAMCNPVGNIGGTVCSCSVTSVPTLATWAWSFGLEQHRVTVNPGIADYLVSNDGCFSTYRWLADWRVSGVRMIDCPAGYYPDDHNPPEVCWRYDPCPVSAPKPYDPDPYPPDDAANLAPRMQTALQCFQTAVRDAGGTIAVESAYRPTAYNRHLKEVWDKWMNELRRDSDPACQVRRTEVENHFNSHKLKPNRAARPHPNSAHTRLDANGNPAGEAIDISSNLPYGVLDVLAFGCNLYGPDPIGDTPHFIHR